MSPFHTKKLSWVAVELDRSSYPVTSRPVTDVRFECPCCGYPMLQERGAFEICRLCGWEDDGQDEADAERVLGGPNYEMSLVAARENFVRHLDTHAPGSKRFRAPTPRERLAKQRIIAAFDGLKRGGADRVNLWQQVLAAEGVLDEELRERVRAIESKARKTRPVKTDE